MAQDLLANVVAGAISANKAAVEATQIQEALLR